MSGIFQRQQLLGALAIIYFGFLSLPSFASGFTEKRQFEKSHSFAGEMANNPHTIDGTFDGDYIIKNRRTGREMEFRYSSSGYVNISTYLDPGIYSLKGSGKFQYQYTSLGVQPVDTGTSYLTVSDVPSSPYQVVATPSVLTCDSDFNLDWDAVPYTEGWTDKVLYKIEERASPVGQALPSAWTVIANNYGSSQPAGFDNTALSLPTGKATRMQYQYRVSTSFVLNGYQSTYSVPRTSAVYIKPPCATEADYAQFQDLSNGKNELPISPPNSAGISFNRLDDLNVDEPLTILNFSKEGIPAAKTIVLSVANVSLRNHVNILGETADLLIVSRNSAASSIFECIHCGFENVNRVTLAQASESGGLLPQNLSVGELYIFPYAKMKVAGLNAPGAFSVELMTGVLELSGTINTNLLARRNAATGDYELSNSGGLTVGVGAFSAYIGGIGVNYKDLELRYAHPLNVNNFDELNTSTLDGNIESQSINLITSENLNVKSILLTDVDVSGLNQYQGALYLPKEGIRIQSLGRKARLNLLSGVSTKTRFDLQAINEAYISSSIYSDYTQIITKGHLSLKSGNVLKSNHIEVGAGTFENNGTILADKVNLNADASIVNRFGGKILGKDIAIVSLAGVVRNGSLTPYRPTGEAIYSQLSQDLQSGGSYYEISGKGSSGEKVDDLSAVIFGDQVKISGATVENVNPYFLINREGEDWSSGVAFSPSLMRQVSIKAANRMEIYAQGRMLNSSAELVAINPASELIFDIDTLINERYRTDFIADLSSLVSTSKCDYIDQYKEQNPASSWQCVATRTTKTLELEPLVYSPPGSIYAAGKSSITIGSALSNRFSFMEFVDMASFYPRSESGNMPQVISEGVLSQGVSYYTDYDPCGEIQYDSQGPASCIGETITGQWRESFGTKETLFWGHNSIYGPGVQIDHQDVNMLINLVSEATGKPTYQLKDMTSDDFASYVRSFIQVILDYIESFTNTVLNAWDSLINWFA